MAENKWFFCSDLHFDHENIIKYCNRPWDTVQEMNVGLVENWNETVRPQDVVIFAGDFTLKHKPEQVLPFIYALNGTIIWVRGNHDWWYKGLKNKISMRDIYTKALPLPNGGKQHIQVCHYPLRSWMYGAWHLHGHTHGTIESELPYSYDVGVDCNNYAPVSWETIIAHMTIDAEMFPNHTPGRDCFLC